MTAADRKSARFSWLLVAIVSISLVSLGGVAGVFVKETHDNSVRSQQNARNLACTQAYDDAQYARSLFLQTYLQPRNDAQARLAIAVLVHAPLGEQQKLRMQFVKADAAYRSASKNNPLPKPPKFSCGGASPIKTPAPTHVPSVPTPTPTPSATPTPVIPSSTPSLGIGSGISTHRPAAPSTVRATVTHSATRTVVRTHTAPAPSASASVDLGGLLCTPLLKPLLCPTTSSGVPTS